MPLWADITLLALATAAGVAALVHRHTRKMAWHYVRLGIYWVDLEFRKWLAKRKK